MRLPILMISAAVLVAFERLRNRFRRLLSGSLRTLIATRPFRRMAAALSSSPIDLDTVRFTCAPSRVGQ